MKKILVIMMAVLMLATTLCFASCGKDEETLTVYTEAGFAPYEFVYENEIVGVDIKIMEADDGSLLEQRNKLVTDGGQYVLDCLGQDDRAHRHATGKTQRASRFRLSDINRVDAGTHQFGHVWNA